MSETQRSQTTTHFAPSSGDQLPPDVQSPIRAGMADSFSYLDAVKNQLSENPDVYNKFIDIMRDLMTQAIDTPEVIQRVSLLFYGYPDLIQGFNNFLPHEYRIIDVSTDPVDPSVITVTTPGGTTTYNTNATSPTIRSRH